MDIASIIFTIDNWLWATPLIALVFILSIVYTVAMKFGNVTKAKLQWKLLTSGGGLPGGHLPL